MNNVYVGLPLQTLPANGDFVFTEPFDTTYMVVLTAFVQFVSAGAGRPAMVIECSKDGGVTWNRMTTTNPTTVAGAGPVRVEIGDARWVYPPGSDRYVTPMNILGHFLCRFGFAMDNGNDPPGEIAFQYGVQLRTPP